MAQHPHPGRSAATDASREATERDALRTFKALTEEIELHDPLVSFVCGQSAREQFQNTTVLASYLSSQLKQLATGINLLSPGQRGTAILGMRSMVNTFEGTTGVVDTTFNRELWFRSNPSFPPPTSVSSDGGAAEEDTASSVSLSYATAAAAADVFVPDGPLPLVPDIVAWMETNTGPGTPAADFSQYFTSSDAAALLSAARETWHRRTFFCNMVITRGTITGLDFIRLSIFNITLVGHLLRLCLSDVYRLSIADEDDGGSPDVERSNLSLTCLWNKFLLDLQTLKMACWPESTAAYTDGIPAGTSYAEIVEGNAKVSADARAKLERSQNQAYKTMAHLIDQLFNLGKDEDDDADDDGEEDGAAAPDNGGTGGGGTASDGTATRTARVPDATNTSGGGGGDGDDDDDGGEGTPASGPEWSKELHAAMLHNIRQDWPGATMDKHGTIRVPLRTTTGRQTTPSTPGTAAAASVDASTPTD